MYPIRKDDESAYIIDMDNTLKWIKEVLGWYGQIEERDENNVGLYG